jgi:anti-sigma-K factor RskA
MTAGRRGRGRWHADSVLASLLEFLPPSPPPAGLLDRIEERIDSIDRAQSAAVERANRIRSGWRVLGIALAGGLAGGAVMAGLVLGDLGGIRACDGPVPIAVLSGVDGTRPLGVEVFADGRYLRLEHGGSTNLTGRALEVWVVAKDDPVPRSLGLLAAKGSATVLPLPVNLGAGDMLALSDEPAGGSPAAGPTGPILNRAVVGAIC